MDCIRRLKPSSSSGRIAIPVKVIDASAAVAWLFDEPEHQRVRERVLRGPLAAPALLPFEIANACAKKMRRQPERREELIAAFAVLFEIEIDYWDVDHQAVLTLANAAGLSAYDASYLWLAQRLDAELITLDQQLATAASTVR